MAFPPSALPTSRTNDQLTADVHPGDHNAAAAAVNSVVAELGADVSGVFGTAQLRFEDIEAKITTALTDIGVLQGTNTVRPVTGVPAPALGNEGDFALNYSAWTIFGPKTESGWGAATSLIGPQGEKGDTGETGATGATGATGPAGADGATGATGATGPAGADGTDGAAGGDITTAAQLPYDGTASGSSATDVQAAIDETKAAVGNGGADPDATVAPATPTSVAAISGHDGIVVSWNGSTDATGYRIFESGFQIVQVAATTRTYVDAAVAAGVSGTYTVAAFNAIGASAESAAVSAARGTGIHFIEHGADATVARPLGAAKVEWYGSVQPDNMVAPDTVVRTDEAV